MYKENAVDSWNGILFSNKLKLSILIDTVTQMNQEANHKDHILYYSMYAKCTEYTNVHR